MFPGPAPWKTETPVAAVHAHHDTAFIVLGLFVVPMLLTYGILLIRRPAQMYSRFWIWSDEPPLKFDLVCCQIMGWIFTVSSTAGPIAVASSLISN